jgi:hypothetical protein
VSLKANNKSTEQTQRTWFYFITINTKMTGSRIACNHTFTDRNNLAYNEYAAQDFAEEYFHTTDKPNLQSNYLPRAVVMYILS